MLAELELLLFELELELLELLLLDELEFELLSLVEIDELLRSSNGQQLNV